MQTPITRENFVASVHAWAKSKGWWNQKRTDDSLLMLMVTEIAEATEEVRKGTPPVYQCGATDPAIRTPDMTECWNEQLKPEGEATELADCAIRIADWFGYKKLSLPAVTARALAQNIVPESDTENPLDFHLSLVEGICAAMLPKFSADELAIVVARIETYFQKKGWDFWEVVNIKMAFNEKRPFRHGGKAF